MNYTTYYSSSDAQIFFTSSDSSNTIKIDTTIGIAYNVNQTSTPIYDLGSRTAKYFSIGNTVCNGLLMIAFTDEEYIKACIQYVTGGIKEVEQSIGSLYGIKKVSNKAFKDKALQQFTNTSPNSSITSIGAINTPFDIKIYLNNETISTSSDTKIISMRDVKLVTDKMEINSNADSYLTQGYSFLFKDIERK